MLPAALKPGVPQSILGLQDPDVEEGQGFFPQWNLVFGRRYRQTGVDNFGAGFRSVT